MRKVKLLSALLAIVMVAPIVVGIGSRATAAGPLLQVLVWTKTPLDETTFASMKLPKLTDYAQGSILTETSYEQLKQLSDSNLQFAVIGRADNIGVGGYMLDIVRDTKDMVVKNIAGANKKLQELANYDYKDYSTPLYYLVRFVGPMKTAWIDKINSIGGQMLDGYPMAQDTYLIRATKEAYGSIASLDYVKGIMLYNPLLKSTSWPKNDTPSNKSYESVVITVPGSVTNDEIQLLSDTLKGWGAETFFQAKIKRFMEEKPPVKLEGMTDEDYKNLVDLWNEDRKPFLDYINQPVSENDNRTIRVATAVPILQVIGGIDDMNRDSRTSKFEVGFIRVMVPFYRIPDIAKLPWVINVDQFVAPEGQNDMANFTIGSQYAWSASEPSGIPTNPMPTGLYDSTGLHGESSEPTTGYIGGTHYRQIVAVCGTGLDTGDLTDCGYSITNEYGTSAGTQRGDFANRVVDHLSYVSMSSGYGNHSDGSNPQFRWPPNTTTRRRMPRGSCTNINAYNPTYNTGIAGQRGQPWMDWDGHDTHVTGSGFGDGYWSRGSAPANNVDDRNPFDRTGAGLLPGIAPGEDDPATAANDGLPYIGGAPYGPANAYTGPWDYRGVAYRAGIVVQRVVDNNFNRAYNYMRYNYPQNYNYRWYMAYVGRPRYIGLYHYPLLERGYLRSMDAMFTIINDAYNVGARIHVDAWVVPHRAPSIMNNSLPPNVAPVPDDRLVTYDGLILNPNEYNTFCTEMDRFCWERKDILLVQAGTTNTRFAAPFIYDWEPHNFNYGGGASLPYGSYNIGGSVAWYDGYISPSQRNYYSSPWIYTHPPMHQLDGFTNLGTNVYPRPIPQRGVYYPPIGDTSDNIDPATHPNKKEFNYFYHEIDPDMQPPATDQTNPFALSDGKTDFATSALSPATAKNPIVCGASESYRSIQQWQPNSGIGVPLDWNYQNMYYWFPVNPLASDNTADSDAPGTVLNPMGQAPWSKDDANGYGQVAAFSGAGPTPDMDYSQGLSDPTRWVPAGRFKPDIVAPGTQIMSAASMLSDNRMGTQQPDWQWPNAWSGQQYSGVRQVNGSNIQEGGPYLMKHPSTASPVNAGTAVGYPTGAMYRHYAIMEGTSCATGFVAGAAAVTRQYYQNRGLTIYPHPQSALIKATLIHGARNLGGEPDYDTAYQRWLWLSAKPSYQQGFGRLDIKKSLFPDFPTVNVYEDHVSGITTGERHFYYYDVLDSTVPFEATLCWTDMPKLPQPQVALANDLDLIVVDPGGTEFHGNVYTTRPQMDEHTNLYESWGRVSLANPGGSSYDRRNTVERVVVPPIQIKKGTWTVAVAGARVEQSSTNIPQTYAFVVSGGQLRAAVAAPPDVPAISTIGLIFVILGMLAVGGFFLIRKPKTA